MEIMKFKNKKGEDLKTTMSDDVMSQVGDIIEEILQNDLVFYAREGTMFYVGQDDMPNLLEAQTEANKRLVQRGVITPEMVAKDINSNF